MLKSPSTIGAAFGTPNGDSFTNKVTSPTTGITPPTPPPWTQARSGQVWATPPTVPGTWPEAKVPALCPTPGCSTILVTAVVSLGSKGIVC